MDERRYHQNKLRVAQRADAPGKMIAGYAAVFNALSVNLGGFRERIQPGAFAASIQDDDVRALLNHDANLVLGRNKNGSLRLVEDSVGLAIEIDPPDTQAARDALTSIERGDIDQMSFGFRTVTDQWMEDPESGGLVRTLIAVKLFDVSPVTFPAYPQTTVGLRGLLPADSTAAPVPFPAYPQTTVGLLPPASTAAPVPLDTVYRALYRAEYGGLEPDDLNLLESLAQLLRRLPGSPGAGVPAADPTPADGDAPVAGAPGYYAHLRHSLELLDHG